MKKIGLIVAGAALVAAGALGAGVSSDHAGNSLKVKAGNSLANGLGNSLGNSLANGL